MRWDGHVKKDSAIARKEKTDHQREKRHAITAAKPPKPPTEKKLKPQAVAVAVTHLSAVAAPATPVEPEVPLGQAWQMPQGCRAEPVQGSTHKDVSVATSIVREDWSNVEPRPYALVIEGWGITHEHFMRSYARSELSETQQASRIEALLKMSGRIHPMTADKLGVCITLLPPECDTDFVEPLAKDHVKYGAVPSYYHYRGTGRYFRSDPAEFCVFPEGHAAFLEWIGKGTGRIFARDLVSTHRLWQAAWRRVHEIELIWKLQYLLFGEDALKQFGLFTISRDDYFRPVFAKEKRLWGLWNKRHPEP